MGNSPSTTNSVAASVAGRIIEAEIKISVDPGHALPLASALYAVENAEGVWLCAFYGTNRSVFDFLPQKGAEVDEASLGIAFQEKSFIPKQAYQAARWEDFVSSRRMAYEVRKGG
jgi:hypothetical protein